jgi:hypothetical protein
MGVTHGARITRVGGFVLVLGFLAFALSAPAAADQYVNWTRPANVAINGVMLQKNGGCQGCPDAGAVSSQVISGDGFADVTVGEPNTFWYAALTRTMDPAQPANFDYAFRFNGAGHADVVEHGIYKGGDTPVNAGDVFRIAVVGGRVQYLRNGAVLYQSQITPQFPLALTVSLGSVGTTVRNARIEPNGAYGPTYQTAYPYPNSYPNQYPYYNDEYGYGGPMIHVDPRQQWTDTGITVSAGQTLTFDASGQVQLSTNPNDTADPRGSYTGRRADRAPFRGAPAGVLLGRIGNDTFVVGSHLTVPNVRAGGRLYLGVNDDYLNDNSGGFDVSINLR